MSFERCKSDTVKQGEQKVRLWPWKYKVHYQHTIITSLSLPLFLFLFTSFQTVAAIRAEWSGIELTLPTVSLKAPGPRGTIAMLIQPRLLLCEKKRPELLMGWGAGGFFHDSKGDESREQAEVVEREPLQSRPCCEGLSDMATITHSAASARLRAA